MDDDVMARVTAAVQRGQAGERSTARQELQAMAFDTSLQVRGFMPSLYLSLADDHRRLGNAARAHEFLGHARATADALGDDAYGALVRGVLDKVSRALAEGSTERLSND